MKKLLFLLFIPVACFGQYQLPPRIQTSNLTITSPSLGTTPVDGIFINNPTAASVGAQQYSPYFHIGSNGWGTTLGTSQRTDWYFVNEPVQGATPSSNLTFYWSLANGTKIPKQQFTSQGHIVLTGAIYYANRPSTLTTYTDGFVAQSVSAATVGNTIQNSVGIRWTGYSWNTTTSASNQQDVTAQVRPTTGTTTGAVWALAFQNNNGGANDKLTVDNLGNAVVSGKFNSASLTVNTALVSDASKNIVSSSTTNTELGYLSGVTSAIQTQLGTKGGLNTNNSWNGANTFNSTFTLTSPLILSGVSASFQGGAGAVNVGVSSPSGSFNQTLQNANGTIALTSDMPIAGSYSTTATAQTTFTVTIGATQANTAYKVNTTPTSLLAAAVFYVTNKTTTTFDVVYLTGITGAVAFDWSLFK